MDSHCSDQHRSCTVAHGQAFGSGPWAREDSFRPLLAAPRRVYTIPTVPSNASTWAVDFCRSSVLHLAALTTKHDVTQLLGEQDRRAQISSFVQPETFHDAPSQISRSTTKSFANYVCILGRVSSEDPAKGPRCTHSPLSTEGSQSRQQSEERKDAERTGKIST